MSQIMDVVNKASSKLMLAACRGNADQCGHLVRNGANIDCEDPDGFTPLMLATLKNHIDVVKVLLEYSCDIDLKTRHGRSALHLAIWNKRKTITQLLLKHGSNTSIRDHFGETPLLLAVSRGYSHLVQAILSNPKCDVHVVGPEKDTAMHYAAKYGRHSCIQLLKSYGAEIDPKNLWGFTPLLLAVIHGNSKTALELINHDASIDITDRNGRTVLLHAIRNNLGKVVLSLLHKEVNVDCEDANGNRALTEAIQYGNPEISALLIRANCDVNSAGRCSIQGQINGKFPPVVLAFFLGRLGIADLLVQSGCDTKNLRKELSNGILTDKLSQSSAMQKLCRQTFNEPQSLLILSRKAFTKHLRSLPFARMKMMIIPPGLVDCLNYNDILTSCKPITTTNVFHYSKMQVLVRY